MSDVKLLVADVVRLLTREIAHFGFFKGAAGAEQ
jgi:hypothetical protein